MNELQPKTSVQKWFHDYKVELGLFFAICLLATVYSLFPNLRTSLKSVYFVPVAISALLLGWRKSSAFTVLGVSLVLCVSCHDWTESSAREFFELIIWGCTMATTSGLIGLIVLTKDRQVLRLLEKQNSLALTDQLTQVSNRRAFDLELRRRISEFTRYRRDLTVLMVDIDYFKQFNDRYGHGVGDTVLQTIARTIENSLRDADLVARFGGEEFAVLLPNTRIDEAMVVAERIRSAVDQIAESDVNCPEKVSVSIGITQVEVTDSQASVMERADMAMYEAKKGGRNRACIKRLHEIETDTKSEVTPGPGELIASVFAESQTLHQVVDPVTSLSYLKIFETEVSRRIYESARYGVEHCLGLIRMEHDEGDEINRADIRVQMANIGRTINKSLRASDIVTWYSPNEFAIMLPFTRKDDSEKVMHRIQLEIASDMYQSGINSLFKVESMRVLQLDACESKDQTMAKLKESAPVDFSLVRSYS